MRSPRPTEAEPASNRPGGAPGGLLGGRRRAGIGGKLILAFGAIAGLTILVSTVTWILFGNVRDNLTIIAEDNLPEIVASFGLAEESAQLSAAIPRMVVVRSEAALAAQEERLHERLERRDETGQLRARRWDAAQSELSAMCVRLAMSKVW